MTTTHALLLVVIFLAVFTQSLAGFGVALVAMAWYNPGIAGIYLILMAVSYAYFEGVVLRKKY